MDTTKLHPARDKSKIWATQEQKALEAFKRRPATRLMVSASTGIPIQNLCRYCYKWLRNRTLFIVKTDICAISGMRAEYLSADRKYAPNDQLKMFEA